MPRSPKGAGPASSLSLTHALNEKIREFLTRERLSQREFAERLGVTQGAVSYLLAEKRRVSVLDYYERLAQVFGTSLSLLVAELEQRVGGKDPVAPVAPPATEGEIAHAPPTTPSVYIAFPPGRPEDSVAYLRTVVEAHFDSRVQHALAQIEARVEAAFVEFERRQRHSTAAPRPRKRRRPAPKKRPDDRAASLHPVRPDSGDGDALSTRRGPPGGGLRRAG